VWEKISEEANGRVKGGMKNVYATVSNLVEAQLDLLVYLKGKRANAGARGDPGSPGFHQHLTGEEPTKRGWEDLGKPRTQPEAASESGRSKVEGWQEP